jgi:hypothetical protein
MELIIAIELLIFIGMVWLNLKSTKALLEYANALHPKILKFAKAWDHNWNLVNHQTKVTQEMLRLIYKESNKDAGAIKRRQTWSKKREKKDLKFETGGAKVYKKK